MMLSEIKNRIASDKANNIKEEWENYVISAFHADSGLYLDSEVFEIMKVKNKNDVLKLIDMLIAKVKEMK